MTSLAGGRTQYGEDSLRTAVRVYIAHYHAERNHQGLGNRLIVPMKAASEKTRMVHRKRRLGGMLNYYHRNVA